MIDWISASIPLLHKPIKSGHFLLFNEDGEVLSDKCVTKLFEGSHESKIAIRSQGCIDERTGLNDSIFISGNPSKFLQGHNVFGHDNLVDLLRATFLICIERYDLDINPLSIISAIHAGIVCRIDFTRSLRLENRLQCRSYIKQLSQLAHTKSGKQQHKGFTLALQPDSRRWTVVIYTKGDEIHKHKLPLDFEHADFIHQEAESLVRVELRLRTRELIDINCRKVYQLTPEKLHSLYADYIGRIHMSEKVQLTSDELSSLSRTHQATYLLWKSGVDIQGEMTHDTYYRHVRAIKKIGVDIGVPYQESSVSNVIPLKTVISAEPYEIPQEAFDKGLVFQPKQLRIVANN